VVWWLKSRSRAHALLVIAQGRRKQTTLLEVPEIARKINKAREWG
jgi:hypothetical protein